MAEIYNFQDFLKNVKSENSFISNLPSANDQVFNPDQVERLVELVKSTNNILESIAQSIVGIAAMNDTLLTQSEEEILPEILTANPNAAANPEDDNIESPEELAAKNSTEIVNLLKENNEQNKTQISELRKIFDILNRPLKNTQSNLQTVSAVEGGYPIEDISLPRIPGLPVGRRSRVPTTGSGGRRRTTPTPGGSSKNTPTQRAPSRQQPRDNRGRTRLDRLRSSLGRGVSRVGEAVRGIPRPGIGTAARGLGALGLGLAAADIYFSLEEMNTSAQEKIEIINNEVDSGNITPDEAEILKQGVSRETFTEKGGFLGEYGARFAGASAGATVGAAIGQTLIPIPFVGAAIGGLAGGYFADTFFGEEVGGYGRKVGENIVGGYNTPETNIQPNSTPMILPQTDYPTIQTIPDNNGAGVRELSDENMSMLQGSVNTNQFNVPIISSSNVVNNRTSYVPRTTSPRNTTSPLDQYFSRIQSFT